MFDGLVMAAIGGFGTALLAVVFVAIRSLYRRAYGAMFAARDAAAGEGRIAFSNGAMKEANPYTSSDVDRAKGWLDGWEKAERTRQKFDSARKR